MKKKEAIEIGVIAAGLFFLLLFFIIKGCGKPAKTKKAAPPIENKILPSSENNGREEFAAINQQSKNNDKDIFIRKQKELLKLDFSRDPFNLPKGEKSVREKKILDLEIRGISLGESQENDIVMIGDYDIYKVGDTIKGFKIIKIESKKITLKKDGRTYEKSYQPE
jgi:hypothetical protein